MSWKLFTKIYELISSTKSAQNTSKLYIFLCASHLAGLMSFPMNLIQWEDLDHSMMEIHRLQICMWAICHLRLSQALPFLSVLMFHSPYFLALRAVFI